MNEFRKKLRTSPAYARVAPFVIFLVLTTLQDMLGGDLRYWLYAAKTVVGAWIIWELWPIVTEMRWSFSLEAVAVGIAIFVIWVGLDPYVPKNHLFFEPGGGPWNPNTQFGEGSAMAWFFVVVRIAGSTIVVPPLEEMFYRSFLYRYFVRTDFQNLPLNHRHLLSWVVTSLLFGLVHYEWLAGILCGLAYQWLVLRKNRLGDAMTAHAITNFILGIYIVWRGAWGFW